MKYAHLSLVGLDPQGAPSFVGFGNVYSTRFTDKQTFKQIHILFHV